MNERIETKLIPDSPYLLLTPGSLSSSRTVNKVKPRASSNGDTDYPNLIQEIRQTLVRLATSVDGYTSVLMSGGGTASVESVIGSVIPERGKLAVLASSVYGNRIVAIARYLKIPVVVVDRGELGSSRIESLSTVLESDSSITHVAVVHCDTTTGLLNPIEEIGKIVKANDKVFIVDAMNSFAEEEVDVGSMNIDFMISSADKRFEGSPDIGFIIAREERMREINEIARTSGFELYAQWKNMESNNGKWSCTFPTHVLRNYVKVLKQLAIKGGGEPLAKRHHKNQCTLVEGMRGLGFRTLHEDGELSDITLFRNPCHQGYSFKNFSSELKTLGVAIYPGEAPNANCFYIGNISNADPENIQRVVSAIGESMYWQDDMIFNEHTMIALEAVSEVGWIP